MSWIKAVLRELSAGRSVQLKGRGESMRGRITDREVVTLAPVGRSAIAVGDIVLVRIRKDRFVTHLVKRTQGGRFLIGNNLGKDDGWVTGDAIYGKVVRIGEDPDFGGISVDEDEEHPPLSD